MYAPRQFHVRQAGIGLKLTKNLQIGAVEVVYALICRFYGILYLSGQF